MFSYTPCNGSAALTVTTGARPPQTCVTTPSTGSCTLTLPPHLRPLQYHRVGLRSTYGSRVERTAKCERIGRRAKCTCNAGGILLAGRSTPRAGRGLSTCFSTNRPAISQGHQVDTRGHRTTSELRESFPHLVPHRRTGWQSAGNARRMRPRSLGSAPACQARHGFWRDPGAPRRAVQRCKAPARRCRAAGPDDVLACAHRAPAAPRWPACSRALYLIA